MSNFDCLTNSRFVKKKTIKYCSFMDHWKRVKQTPLLLIDPPAMTDLSSLKLHDLLGQALYVQLDDTRSLVGKLVAIDCGANFLLDEVMETNEQHSRNLGLVSVPFKTVQSVKIKSSLMTNIKERRASFSDQFL